MPELPEVEILARHLRPVIQGRTIRGVQVRREKVLKPISPVRFTEALHGAKFLGLTRRGKYLLFEMRAKNSRGKFTLLGHLGMTGRMFLAPKNEPLSKHAAVVFDLGNRNFIFDDVRVFGRMTLDLKSVEKLGPEPLDGTFTPELFGRELKRSRQAIKVKLLDQSLVAGVGNIYASEALFLSGISPRLAANRLTRAQVQKLWRAIRAVLNRAIKFGSTVPLNLSGQKSDGLFYYGSAVEDDGGIAGKDFYTERLQVYDRHGKPCYKCKTPLKRVIQAARSTFYCPQCQKT